MAAITATALKTILDVKADYPFPNTRPLQFYTTKPKYPIFPYVVIRKSPPQSSEETITDTTKKDGFEITLYVRYTRDQATEEAEQTTIEDTILSKLETTSFGANALYFESKQWRRTPIPQLYGSQSAIEYGRNNMLFSVSFHESILLLHFSNRCFILGPRVTSRFFSGCGPLCLWKEPICFNILRGKIE